MKSLLIAVLLAASAFSAVVNSQDNTPVPILPGSMHWTSPPNISGLQTAWVLGAERRPGAYILRVKLAAGTRIPPHTHPDARNTTVLSGTIYVGFGKTFDETRVVAVPAGAVYVVPANVPHYIWARDGEALYQEAGRGPTGTAFIKR